MHLPVITVMLHSSELMPGGSPYNPSEASIEALHRKLDGLFAFLGEEGWRGTTLRAFAEECPT
jgi:hypothetical protein